MTPTPDSAEYWREIAQRLAIDCFDATRRMEALTDAFAILRGTLVPFNERTQEFFCKVCRYRDPLGPDGNKLHDEHCPFLAVLDLLERSVKATNADAVDPAVRDSTS